MGKPFGKKPNDWLRLPATISLLKTLVSARKSRTSDYQPIIRKMGSPASGGGTWFHEDVAIEYARWLSEEFKIWCKNKTNHRSLRRNIIKIEFVYNRIITNLLKKPKLDGVLLRVADIFLKTT
jgi:hypothetical protein